MNTLYLISGCAGSGKSTISKYISEKLHIPRYALADSLKEALVDISKLFDQPIRLSDLYDYREKQVYRHKMQVLGTDILRKYFDDNIFCRALKNKLIVKQSFIIDDIRFRNEFIYWVKFAKDYGFFLKTLRVIRFTKNSLDFEEQQHSSEQLLDFKCRNIIYNESSLKKLYEGVDKFLKDYPCDETSKDYGNVYNPPDGYEYHKLDHDLGKLDFMTDKDMYFDWRNESETSSDTSNTSNTSESSDSDKCSESAKSVELESSSELKKYENADSELREKKIRQSSYKTKFKYWNRIMKSYLGNREQLSDWLDLRTEERDEDVVLFRKSFVTEKEYIDFIYTAPMMTAH